MNSYFAVETLWKHCKIKNHVQKLFQVSHPTDYTIYTISGNGGKTGQVEKIVVEIKIHIIYINQPRNKKAFKGFFVRKLRRGLYKGRELYKFQFSPTYTFFFYKNNLIRTLKI